MEKTIKVNVINETTGEISQWELTNSSVVANIAAKINRMAKKTIKSDSDNIIYQLEVSTCDSRFVLTTNQVLKDHFSAGGQSDNYHRESEGTYIRYFSRSSAIASEAAKWLAI